MIGGAAKLTTAAQLLVITTLFTSGANCFTDFKTSVVPLIAGSRNSRLSLMTRYRKGEAVWITVSKGGEDCTTLLKAPGVVMSGTMPKSSCEKDVLGKSAATWSALAWEADDATGRGRGSPRSRWRR